MENTNSYAITISRMLGGGGVIIGKQLAERLNIAYFDKEIIFKAAEKFGVNGTELEQYDERKTSIWEWFLKSGIMESSSDMYVNPIINPPTDKQLFEAESEIIQRISHECPSVIVGRGGSYVLRDHPRHISIFLHCSTDLRVRRIQEAFQLTEKKAQKLVATTDSQRAQYLRLFTGRDWTDSRQYTLCLDTGEIALDDCAELIYKYVAHKFGGN